MSELRHPALALAKALQKDCDQEHRPSSAGAAAKSDKVVYFAMVKSTRGYIEQIVHQINGAYERGWHDACAVMIRRLVETLIIETFEAHSIAHKIKNSKGDFFFLSDLIPLTISETSWNLGRNTKQALPRLKDVGDKSAHSRRFVAHREDIDKVITDLRVVVQELLFLAKLK